VKEEEETEVGDSSKPSGWTVIGAIVLILGVIAIAVWWVMATASASCDTFRYWAAKDVPARCAGYYQNAK
jgi:hypothetical protein